MPAPRKEVNISAKVTEQLVGLIDQKAEEMQISRAEAIRQACFKFSQEPTNEATTIQYRLVGDD